jgi:hypothetical protein
MARRTNEFQAIHSEGGLLPPDLLRRVLDPKEEVPGTRPEDYGLPENERINETITQSWNRLQRHWKEFRAGAERLPEGEAGTGLTNEKWSLPLMRELGFGMLPSSPGPEIDGRTYAISRFVGPAPLHLIGCGLSLDRRAAGQRGAAAANPHGLVQDLLNRSDPHLWAIVSNGLRLRILRDSQALSRQSYLEFDLEAMFEGEVFSDFVLLWLTAHATRFAILDGDRPESCWLEQWTKLADEQGTRALGDLRQGVEKTLEILGQGFVGHPRNTALRESLRSGELSLNDFHGQLLRVVYQLIFLFVAEDRTLDGVALLHPRDEIEVARQSRDRFASHYGTTRLRELASNIKGSRHGDLWQQFHLLVGALSGDERFAASREHLALPVLGSSLWDPTSTSALNAASLTGSDGTELSNADFLEALRHLAFIRQDRVLRPVDYKNLGSEELGGVYETLLALTPQISGDGARFTFAEFAGSERKTSGSYYTPDSLVQCLLDSALDPVVERAIEGKTGVEAEKAILSLKVCDPAVGSGHFLVGAAHRLARHLARVRALAEGEGEPSPLLYQQALRNVIGRCIYGVDINPMSAELCRVSLWLEAIEPGKPLSFLDHHIRVGNSLLGATPELIAGGLPNEVFNPIVGDDREACAILKRRNRDEREGAGPLFAGQDAEAQAQLQRAAAALEKLPDDRPEDIRAKELALRRHEQTEAYLYKKQLADSWCAAFVIKKYFRKPGSEASVSGITQGHLNDLAAGRQISADLTAEVECLLGQYQFFHWHLAFPEVFANGGFDCVLGNPPWERVKMQEKEWFAERSPEIASAPNAATRRRMIEELKTSDPEMYRQYLDGSRKAEGESHLLRDSDRYPLCGRGDINLYTVFAEGMRNLLNEHGRTGYVVPTGIATDDTTKFFFQNVMEKKSLISLFDFENRRGLFPGVHRSMKFCLFTAGSGLQTAAESAEFIFFAHAVDDLRDPQRLFTLSTDEITRLNPNTQTCPIFRSRMDANLTKSIYFRVPILIREANNGEPEDNPWEVRMRQGLYHLTNDSANGTVLDSAQAELPDVPLVGIYEAKQMWQFAHRFSSYQRDLYLTADHSPVECSNKKLSDPSHTLSFRYCSTPETLGERIPEDYPHKWWLVYRDITNTTNERTAVAAIIPRIGVAYTLRVFTKFPHCGIDGGALGANLNSFVFDYCVRQIMAGTHLSDYILRQLPILPPFTYEHNFSGVDKDIAFRNWLQPRVLELTYTAWDLEPFAQDCGWSGPPFRWDEKRRYLLRCELDAAFFHLYLPAEENGDWSPAVGEVAEDLESLKDSFPTPRDAVGYIMDTFPIVKRKDEEKYGDYRTKLQILEIYDRMQQAIVSGERYQTLIDPPPADPRVAHPADTRPDVSGENS